MTGSLPRMVAYLSRKRRLFSLQNVRTRKCSIVQEEEDEDDVSSCSGRDDRGSNSALNSFNRRGSRSEGKLSHILQEKLSQLPEKHSGMKPAVQGQRHQKEETAAVISDVRGEKLKQSARNEKDNKTTSSPVHPKTTKIQTSEVLLEELPTPWITSTREENLKNLLSDANTQPTAGWIRKATGGTEVRPKLVTECLKSSGPAVPTNKWKSGAAQHHRSSLPPTELTTQSTNPSRPSEAATTTTTTTTTILMESSTVSIPLRPIGDNQLTLIPKYKTMPSPSSANSPGPQLTLNEILEDGDCMQVLQASECGGSTTAKCRVVRRTTYEQRRSKFHKTRTTSCSSSDASDDDSESRKKRAHKLGASTGKSLPPRRDSHDDSSDSQDPGGSGGGRGGVGGGGSGVSNGEHTTTNAPTTTEGSRNDSGSGTNTNTTTTTTGGGGGGGGRHRCTENQSMFGRRHRAGRRRAGETRLRESQSLNRITEVQEAEAPSSCYNHCHASRNSTVLGTPNNVSSPSSSSSVSQSSATSHSASAAQPASQVTTTVQKAKGLGARLLQSWSLGTGKTHQASKHSAQHSVDGKANSCHQRQSDDCRTSGGHVADDRRPAADHHKCANQSTTVCHDKENRNASMHRNECKSSSRKIRLLSRYFAVHKKLCVPLPGIFGKGRLYKARSCGSITRDRVSPPSPKSMLLCPPAEDKWRERQQWCDAKQHRGSDGDINQNLGLAHLVQESIVGKGCADMPTVCHIHLGDASKCCSLC